MKCPEVAILLATYNGEKYLAEQLDSLLSQKFPSGGGTTQIHTRNRRYLLDSENTDIEEGSSKSTDYRIYIHDDGSSDNTVSIIHSYVEKYPEKIVKVEGPPTGGAKNNFFFLMQEVMHIAEESSYQTIKDVSSPRYYFFCDQDDIWLEDKLQTELSILMDLEKDEETNQRAPSMVWCDMMVVDENLNVISQSFSSYSNLKPEELNLDRCIMHGKAAGCSIACNKELLQLCCEISNTQDIIMHDWAIILIAKIVGRLEYISKPMVLYRQHKGNELGAINESITKTIASIIGRLITLKQLKATQTDILRHIAQVASLKQVKEVYIRQMGLIDGATNFILMSRCDKVRFVNKYRIYRHPHNILWTSLATFFIK